MKSRLLQKYFLLVAATLMIFVVLGFVFNAFVMDFMRSRHEQTIPPMYIAHMIDHLDPNDRLHSIELYEKIPDRDLNSNVILYDSEGHVVYKTAETFARDLSSEFVKQFSKPFDAFPERREFAMLPPQGEHAGSGGPPGELLGEPEFEGEGRIHEREHEFEREHDHEREHERGELSSFVSKFFMHFGPGVPPPRHLNMVIRLSGEKIYYVGIRPASFRPEGFGRYLPVLGPVSLIISLLLGVLVAINLIYASIRKKIIEADKVISEIQRGNLKARFEVGRKNEFGEAMLRFNQMADEIEKLVDHLRLVEAARNKILQELAHDLRTPVASLKNLLEMLDAKNDNMAPEVRKELTGLSLREIDFFGQLVEDLLLLAQVDEPKYKAENNKVFVTEVMDDVVGDCASRPMYKDKKSVVRIGDDNADLQLLGSYNLFYRMFRNALENALNFARSKVQIEFKKSEKTIRVTITDDGPGLTEAQLRDFGVRKQSRHFISTENGQRLSVGLGSVIIKKLAEAHHGEVAIENLKNDKGEVMGARLTFEFLV